MSRLFSNPRPQFIKTDGTVNANGKIYFYEPGVGSSTLKSVYSDYLFASALTNPVILDINGKTQTNIFLDGDYKWVITDSAGVTIETGNNYDPPELDAQFGDWDATITYAVNDFVRGSDGNYYQSLSSGNVGNNPTSSDVYWSQKRFISVWNTNETYVQDATVEYEGDLYKSLLGSNTGNQPDISSTYWKNLSLITEYVAGRTYAINDIVKYGGDVWVSLQNSNTGNTPSTSSTYWRSFFVPAAISTYTGSSFEYRFDDFSAGSFTASTEITQNTYESVGPTGSGADYIWTAMDLMPSNAKYAIIQVLATVRREAVADGVVTHTARARKTGTSVDSASNTISNGAAEGGTTLTGYIYSRTEATIPLDGSLRFDFKWSNTGATTDTIFVYLLGFKV